MKEIEKNAIVGQSGGPTASINATLFGVICACYDCKNRIKRLYGMKNGIEGLLREDLVNLFSFCEDKERLELLKSTPASALGSCRMRLPDSFDEKIYQRVLEILEGHGIGYFFYIGGNDSMDTVNKLSLYAKSISSDIKFIGIPKTIDNDLPQTDHTPGYGSCAKFVATVTREILRDTSSYTTPSVTIIEVMGRHTGWLGLAAALASDNGARLDGIYLPEIPFSREKFLSDIRKALFEHPNVVVCVCEGIKDEKGEYVFEKHQTDSFGNTYLSGVGQMLVRLIKEKIGCKARSVELSLTQRCSAHIASGADIEQSVKIGMASVELALDGKTAVMSAYKRTDTGDMEVISVPVGECASKTKPVPREYISECGTKITQKGIDYLKPLISAEHYPCYRDGLPCHFIID